MSMPTGGSTAYLASVTDRQLGPAPGIVLRQPLHRVRLSPDGTRRFRDLQVAHATLEAATEGSGVRLLWALPRRDVLLVRADHCALNPAWVVRQSSTSIDQTLTVGDKVSLSMVVNPVRQEFVRGGRGRRRSVPPGDTESWLTSRLPGVEIHECVSQDLGTHGGWRQGVRITVAWRAITARATVTDPAALTDRIGTGLGHAKAYGCGLILCTVASA